MTVACATAAESDKDDAGDVGKEPRSSPVFFSPPPTSTLEPIRFSIKELEAATGNPHDNVSKFQDQWMHVTGGTIRRIFLYFFSAGVPGLSE